MDLEHDVWPTGLMANDYVAAFRHIMTKSKVLDAAYSYRVPQ